MTFVAWSWPELPVAVIVGGSISKGGVFGFGGMRTVWGADVVASPSRLRTVTVTVAVVAESSRTTLSLRVSPVTFCDSPLTLMVVWPHPLPPLLPTVHETKTFATITPCPSQRSVVTVTTGSSGATCEG